MEKFTKAFPLRLSAPMYRKVKAAAEREYLTVSAYLRKIIREAVTVEGKR